MDYNCNRNILLRYCFSLKLSQASNFLGILTIHLSHSFTCTVTRQACICHYFPRISGKNALKVGEGGSFSLSVTPFRSKILCCHFSANHLTRIMLWKLKNLRDNSCSAENPYQHLDVTWYSISIQFSKTFSRAWGGWARLKNHPVHLSTISMNTRASEKYVTPLNTREHRFPMYNNSATKLN